MGGTLVFVELPALEGPDLQNSTVAGQNLGVGYFSAPKAGHRRHAYVVGAQTDVIRKILAKTKSAVRSEMIMLTCDGVWTQRKKMIAGLIPSDACPWCGQPENLQHLLYECPHWCTYRDAFRKHIPMLQGGTPCRALCLVPDEGVPGSDLRQWEGILQGASALLRTRLQDLPRPKEKHGVPLRDDPVCPMLPKPVFRFLTFCICEGIRKGVRPWPFSARAWQMMVRWAMQLRHKQPQLHDHDLAPTLLEAYVSFVLTNQGLRLETGRGVAQNGHWVSNQLAAFKAALQSFQALTDSEPLLARPPHFEAPMSWLRPLGFPKQECLVTRVYLPHWPEVRNLTRKAPRQLYPRPLTSRFAERWRRWEVGIPGSQEHGGGIGHCSPPIWAIPLPRIREKIEMPPWWSQIVDCKQMVARFNSRPEAHLKWDGLPLLTWIAGRGGGLLTYTMVQGLVSALMSESKRCSLIHDMEPTHRQNLWHLAQNVGSQRETSMRPLRIHWVCFSSGSLGSEGVCWVG